MMGWRKVWVDVDPTGDVIVKLPANATLEVPKALLGTPRYVWVLEQTGGEPDRCNTQVFATFQAAKAEIPSGEWKYPSYGTYTCQVDSETEFTIRKQGVGP